MNRKNFILSLGLTSAAGLYGFESTDKDQPKGGLFDSKKKLLVLFADIFDRTPATILNPKGEIDVEKKETLECVYSILGSMDIATIRRFAYLYREKQAFDTERKLYLLYSLIYNIPDKYEVDKYSSYVSCPDLYWKKDKSSGFLYSLYKRDWETTRERNGKVDIIAGAMVSPSAAIEPLMVPFGRRILFDHHAEETCGKISSLDDLNMKNIKF